MPIKPSAKAEIIALIEQYKGESSPLMMVLEAIQKKFGYIPLDVQELVAEKLGMPFSEVYGVVTFYNFFSLNPKGKYVIGVCLGTACYVKNAQAVLDKIEQILKIKPGETTEDGLFTIEALRCIGACALAPAMSINGKVYGQVKPNQIEGILNSYRQEEGLL